MFAVADVDEFIVTVNVAFDDWLAENVCDPERPVPDVFKVSVPFCATATVAQEAFVPSVVRYFPLFPVWLGKLLGRLASAV